MKIIFKLIDEQHVDIMCGEKKIGHIFTPGGTGECYTNAIQVCGFEEAFDLWGCGLFGEEAETKYLYSEQQLKHLRMLAENATDGKFWNDLADKGYTTEKTTIMKRDIQLRFKAGCSMSTEFTQKIMFKGFMWIGIILLILITAIVLLALKPTLTVNNYVAAGNYSFDIGPNLVNYMDKANQSIAQEQIIPSRKVDKVLAAYQTLNNSNTTLRG